VNEIRNNSVYVGSSSASFVKLVYVVLYDILCDMLAILQDIVVDFMLFTKKLNHCFIHYHNQVRGYSITATNIDSIFCSSLIELTGTFTSK
jgi:hypothetical protein